MFKAEAAAQKALALDSQLAEGHHALAAVHLYYSWDWATAERELKLALEFNPNLSEAHNAYGDYFKVMGQYEQAVAEYTKAQKLDPLKPLMSADLALALTVVQRYEEADEAARKALEVDPDFSMAHYTIALAKEQQGDYRQAAAKWHDILVADNKKALATLLQKTYESSGYASMKQLMARKNIEAARRASPKDTSPVDIAGWYAQIGDNQHAFELLEQAYDEHLWPLPVVQTGPEFARIRDDPRFQDLVRRIRAPH